MFSGSHNSDAFSLDLIKSGISYCANLFKDKNYHITFLADRWFPFVDILEHIQSIGCFYVIRCKSNDSISFYNSNNVLISRKISSISAWKHDPRYFKDILYTSRLFKTSLVVARSINTDESWYLLTNDKLNRAVRNYSYRFGSIECIFKSQKSNGFRLESTRTRNFEHFISLFTIMCVALVWLTIIGSDYSKNKHHYHLKIRDTRKLSNGSSSREYSFFNLGLTIFNLCYYNYVDFVLKFNFLLYDI